MTDANQTTDTYYSDMTRDDLRAECKARGMRRYSRLTKPELVAALMALDEHTAPVAPVPALTETPAQNVTVTNRADISAQENQIDGNGHMWRIARRRGNKVRYQNMVTGRMDPWERVPA